MCVCRAHDRRKMLICAAQRSCQETRRPAWGRLRRHQGRQKAVRGARRRGRRSGSDERHGGCILRTEAGVCETHRAGPRPSVAPSTMLSLSHSRRPAGLPQMPGTPDKSSLRMLCPEGLSQACHLLTGGAVAAESVRGSGSQCHLLGTHRRVLKTRDVGIPTFGVHGNQTMHMPITKCNPELVRHPTWRGMWPSAFLARWNAQSFIS